ncbi:alpha/beta hydrolase [Ruficoccus amylovorans]|uniref:Alpha/beta hydrolase n=1 Tax=Ruficoccus amylovorans TaxID=1804625 RepID=A0A842HCE9_9BACT|nr:alpha/beta hydrolase [Ruficoccus amylovorans]MBC2593071.1 alpha/beta hydrolase [Ruficoccus amylovorans]
MKTCPFRGVSFFFLLTMAIGMMVPALCRAAPESGPFKVEESQVVFKEINGVKLAMSVYSPVMKERKDLPAIIFFHGGGWNVGSRRSFDLQAKYLASVGIVVFSADYRLATRDKVTVAECVKDAKSAIRYIRENAKDFGISPDKIVASGASAGAHLAACTAVVEGYDESGDDLDVSAVPDAMILFCAPVRIERERLNAAYQQRFDGQEEALSPYNHVRAGLPPTLLLSGDKDTQVPIEFVRGFAEKMQASGNECVVVEFAGKGHDFSRYDRQPDSFTQSLAEVEKRMDELYGQNQPSWLEAYVATLKQ